MQRLRCFHRRTHTHIRDRAQTARKLFTFGSGRVRALNLTVPLGSGRVGSGRVVSDDLGYGPGSGFSFEPVQDLYLAHGKMSWGSHLIECHQ